MKILLFIPGYNCEKQVTRVLDQIDEQILPYISKIIMVNNRSTDNTEQAVVNYAKNHPQLNLAVLRNDDNYVLGGSHKVAFEFAIANDFDYVIVLHGDDQGDIHDLYPILKNEDYKNYDCCLGTRFMKGSKLIGYSKLRIIGNYCFNILYSICAGKSIKDLGSGLNMYKVSSLKNRYYIKYPDKLYFNAVMVMASSYYKQKVKYFPITWKEDDQTSNAKLVSLGISLLKIPLNYLFRRKSYMQKELREKIVENYTYKVIYDSGKTLETEQVTNYED